MNKLMKTTAWATVIFLTGFLMSCNNQSENELGMENQGKGRVIFKITDAPFPVDLVEEANITIDWIKLLKYPEGEVEEEETAEGESILIELEEPATFNLLELRNGLTAELAEVEVPAGSYAEIRLHVTDADILLKDGMDFKLKVPGGDASGLKLKLEPALEVADGGQAEVLLDFDLSRSFVMQGNPNNIIGFIFKPVVRAVANVETNTGEISGVVADIDGNPVANASLTLLDGEEIIASALTSEDEGFYSMIGILPGDYTLVLEVDEYNEEVEVTVEAGITTVQNFLTGEVTEIFESDDTDSDDE